MAKIAGKKIRNNSQKIKVQNGFFSRFKITESYTSLILGAIVVLIAGIIVLSFAKVNRNMETSSDKDFLSSEKLNLQESNTSSTYTVRPGDDLWTISENVYNDGYKWVEIAKLNKLQNPGLIYAGSKLIIPTQKQVKQVAINPSPTVKIQNTQLSNNPITGTTYVIKSGDNLWNICVRAYGDGYRWPEIAKINHLNNPDLIFSGNTLQLPR
jgi:nucleoid-associated protein YgaU